MFKFFRIFSIPIYAFVGVVQVYKSGFSHDAYLYHVRGITDQPYPLNQVITFIFIVLIESFVTYIVIRPKTFCHSFLRSVSALFVCLPLLVFWLLGVMHAAPYFYAHLYWFLIGVALLLLLALYSGIITLYKAHNKTLQSPVSQAGTSGSDVTSGP